MIGLNFSPRSLRCISLETERKSWRRCGRSFRAIQFVGVFLDQERDVVRRIASALPLDAVQLHGDESPDYVRELALPVVIKALRVAHDSPVAAMRAYECAAILLDTWNADAPGGTGETFPWAMAAAARAHAQRLILAGGLTSANVGEAIRTVRPFAVDVCSGVESAPGKKDENKVRSFVDAVRSTAAMPVIL